MFRRFSFKTIFNNTYHTFFHWKDLKYLKISGTALSKLSICSQAEHNRKHYKYYCDQFQNLVYLDIRNNQLENLEANGLSRLTDVYLSGKLI